MGLQLSLGATSRLSASERSLAKKTFGVPYWRFNDRYAKQIGVGANTATYPASSSFSMEPQCCTALHSINPTMPSTAPCLSWCPTTTL